MYIVLITTAEKMSENITEAAEMAVRREKYLHFSIASMLKVLNNFIKIRFVVKSRACKVLVDNEHTSNVNESTGTHFCVIS